MIATTTHAKAQRKGRKATCTIERDHGNALSGAARRLNGGWTSRQDGLDADIDEVRRQSRQAR
jgi:hypothetical protein